MQAGTEQLGALRARFHKADEFVTAHGAGNPLAASPAIYTCRKIKRATVAWSLVEERFACQLSPRVNG